MRVEGKNTFAQRLKSKIFLSVVRESLTPLWWLTKVLIGQKVIKIFLTGQKVIKWFLTGQKVIKWFLTGQKVIKYVFDQLNTG